VLDGRGTKRSALSDKKKYFRKILIKSLETRNFVDKDKDKDVPVNKEDRSSKRILKTLLTQHIKEQQASHQNICINMYA